MSVRLHQFAIVRASAAVLLLFVTGGGPALASEAPAQRKTTQSESYVSTDPIYATIAEGTRPRGLLMIELGLDVPDEPLRARVTHALPTLRDAYVRSLMAYRATAVRPWRQPSVDDIAARMQTITDRLMGQQGAKVPMAQTAMRLTR